jgi:hypothetical protein
MALPPRATTSLFRASDMLNQPPRSDGQNGILLTGFTGSTGLRKHFSNRNVILPPILYIL